MTTVEQQPPKEGKYIDFMSRFKKEASYFKAPRTETGKQWPRIRPVQERHYDNWIAEVVDPVTGEFYTDNEGNSARQYVDKIIRYRDLNGKEYLYSIGQLVGFNSFKDKKTYSYEKAEVHIKTNFGYTTVLDKKRGNQIKRVTTGPQSVEEVFDMPFNDENATKLWNLKRNRNIQLILKDGITNEAHNVDRKGPIASNDLNKAFEFFKSKPFDYLYNWEYTKEEERKEQLDRIEKQYGKNIADELRKQDNNNNNNNNNNKK